MRQTGYDLAVKPSRAPSRQWMRFMQGCVVPRRLHLVFFPRCQLCRWRQVRTMMTMTMRKMKSVKNTPVVILQMMNHSCASRRVNLNHCVNLNQCLNLNHCLNDFRRDMSTS